MKKRKWNHIKCSSKITRGRKLVNDKYRNKEQGQQTLMSMLDFDTIISVIILNIYSLNAPIKTEIVECINILYVVYKKPILNIKTHR